MSFAERLARNEKAVRAIKRAEGYLDSSTRWIWTLKNQKDPLPFEYLMLTEKAVRVATEIVESLPERYFMSDAVGDAFGLPSALGLDPNDHYNLSDDLLEEAMALVEAIKKQRKRHEAMQRILALENVSGRSPEEAQLYQARAVVERMKFEEEYGIPK